MHFHRPRCVAFFHGLMVDKHIIPLVGHPELVIPEKVPNFLGSCVLKDSTTLILRRSGLVSSKQNSITHIKS
jgi:hypothetical protein